MGGDVSEKVIYIKEEIELRLYIWKIYILSPIQNNGYFSYLYGSKELKVKDWL